MKHSPSAEHPLWLASRSPRRRALLAEAGVEAHVRPAGIDDGTLPRGAVSPAAWALSLAYLKARWVADGLAAEQDPDALLEGTVLGADTICVHRGQVFGQPSSEEEARQMLRAMRGDTHEILTGACLLGLRDRRRRMLVDRAEVTCGPLSDEDIDTYVASGRWRGKAGGYNLAEQVQAGWPIACAGDPATVMGLRLRRLEPWLAPFRVRSQRP